MEVTLRVVKNHFFCTMPGTEGYEFEWDGIQVLETMGWKKVGEGYIKVYKRCTRGYDEDVLRIEIERNENLEMEIQKGLVPKKLGIDPKDLDVMKTRIPGKGEGIEVKEISGIKLPKEIEIRTNEDIWIFSKDGKIVLVASRYFLYRFDFKAWDLRI